MQLFALHKDTFVHTQTAFCADGKLDVVSYIYIHMVCYTTIHYLVLKAYSKEDIAGYIL